MGFRLNGWPWQGQTVNIPLSNEIIETLGEAQMNATAEAAKHPGLYQARYDDIPTIQLTLRPGFATDPYDLEQAAFESIINDDDGAPPYG